MNLTKDQSNYLKNFDFAAGLPDGTTEKDLMKLGADITLTITSKSDAVKLSKEYYIISGNVSNEEDLKSGDKYVLIDEKFNEDGTSQRVYKKINSAPIWCSQKEDELKGLKHDSNKPRFDLLPADALEEVAKVYAVGAKEYGDRNWELGMNYGRLFRALMSHAWTWWRGERDDSKNKLHHLTSVVFNALALLHYELNSEKFKKFDDRK